MLSFSSNTKSYIHNTLALLAYVLDLLVPFSVPFFHPTPLPPFSIRFSSVMSSLPFHASPSPLSSILSTPSLSSLLIFFYSFILPFFLLMNLSFRSISTYLSFYLSFSLSLSLSLSPLLNVFPAFGTPSLLNMLEETVQSKSMTVSGLWTHSCV